MRVVVGAVFFDPPGVEFWVLLLTRLITTKICAILQYAVGTSATGAVQWGTVDDGGGGHNQTCR